MTQPYRYIIRMVVFLLLVLAAAGALFKPLLEAFQANPALNGLILFVLILGIVYIFRQVITLKPEVDWLDALRKESSGGLIFPGELSNAKPPRLLGPMATMVGDRKGRLSLSALSMRTLLDSIKTRIEESHDISRYLIGLLIFLGLLGTFWGLLETVSAVGSTITNLSIASDDTSGFFEDLKTGLETPLAGMGTAFSSSLFGLAGSLVLGFLELQAGQAHNRFMNDLEEWLSGVTRLSSGAIGDGGGEQSVPAYLQALLEQTADSLDVLQRTIARGEDERQQVTQNLMRLTEQLGTMTDQMRTEQGVLLRLAETQSQLKPLLMRLSEMDFSMAGIDDATRAHIRNLDFHMERLVGDVVTGREQMVQEIRMEIRLLARTIAAIAEEEQG